MRPYLPRFKVALELSGTVAAIPHRFELSQVQLGTSLRFKSQMDGESVREKESPQSFKNNASASHREYAFVKSFVLCARATRTRNEKKQ